MAGLALGSVSKHLNWGAFAEYCIGFDHAAFKIPDSISFEQAATLPVGLAVASLALYQTLGIANPGSGAEKEPVSQATLF